MEIGKIIPRETLLKLMTYKPSDPGSIPEEHNNEVDMGVQALLNDLRNDPQFKPKVSGSCLKISGQKHHFNNWG